MADGSTPTQPPRGRDTKKLKNDADRRRFLKKWSTSASAQHTISGKKKEGNYSPRPITLPKLKSLEGTDGDED